MGQKARVLAVLACAAAPLALHEIREQILDRFRVSDAETAISARIRELRHELARDGRTIVSVRACGKQHHLYQISSAGYRA